MSIQKTRGMNNSTWIFIAGQWRWKLRWQGAPILKLWSNCSFQWRGTIKSALFMQRETKKENENHMLSLSERLQTCVIHPIKSSMMFVYTATYSHWFTTLAMLSHQELKDPWRRPKFRNIQFSSSSSSLNCLTALKPATPWRSECCCHHTIFFHFVCRKVARYFFFTIKF